ncbi:MAG: GGDEF domain-containing protein [Alphaproteobacteria bacterium]|nr:MAG: GGDEF domain-containing protein [Alphaproteobacteria bacterium]
MSCAPAGGVRAAPVLARLAADEFLLLLPAITAREVAAQFAHSVLRAIAAPLEQNGDRLYLSASAGIALAPEDATEAEALLRAAHTALTHAKQRRGSSFAFYTPHVAATQAHRLEIEHRLRQAMASSELLLHYQPQASVQTDEIVGIEALVRWSHPDLGLVSPENFIGIAEEAGITAELGRWVVSRALEEVVTLERRGLPPLRLSINISADMFATMGGRGLAEHIIEELAASGMPGSRVILEVTERSILARAPQTLRAIEHLREHGLRFALDDFGTGYSALGSLKTLPVDEIKIDRSFILGAGIEDVAVLRAIIAMAKTLDLTVIAEGVETPDQLRMLRAESCDLYQGYLCAPALPGPQLLEILKDRNAAPA